MTPAMQKQKNSQKIETITLSSRSKPIAFFGEVESLNRLGGLNWNLDSGYKNVVDQSARNFHFISSKNVPKSKEEFSPAPIFDQL